MLTEVIVAFAIVAISVVLHMTALVLFAEWLFKRKALVYGFPGLKNHLFVLIAVFAVVIFLHLAEAAVWATFYWWQNLFESFETALYFSLISYTTIGFGDVVLPKTWRLLGAVEGVSGVLLCGVSTAFIFAVVTVLFRARIQGGTEPAQVHTASASADRRVA